GEGVGGEYRHRSAPARIVSSGPSPRATLVTPSARARAKAANGGTSTSVSWALTKQGPRRSRHCAKAASTCSALLQSNAANPGNIALRPAPRRERRKALYPEL